MPYLEKIRMPLKLRVLLNRSTRYRENSFEDTREWTFDIDQVVKSMDHLQGFPSWASFKNSSYNGNVLLLRADPKKSFYVRDGDLEGFCFL